MIGTTEKKRFNDRGFEIIKSIGKGAFGEVMLVREHKSRELYGVKIIHRQMLRKKPFLQKYIDQEIGIMKMLNHPNIVRCHSEFDTPDFIVIVMEYCEEGNLLSFQSHLPGRIFPLAHATQVVVEVMKGLRCIHGRNFVHRDIKSENVLLRRVDGQLTYKIADFGFARAINNVGAKTHCGTPKYMAPEILAGQYYGISVDIWALGILFFFMLFADYPFKGMDMRAEILKKCSPVFSLASKKDKIKDSKGQVEDFFRRVFVVDTKKRITFSNIIRHPLFADYQHEFVESVQFYNQFEDKEKLFKDQEADEEQDYGLNMAPEDSTRYQKLTKKRVSVASRPVEYQLEQFFFQVGKIQYLRECAYQFYDNYSSFLTLHERLAAKYYLLKVYLFYTEPFLRALNKDQIPPCMEELQIATVKWRECLRTVEMNKCLDKLREQSMREQTVFQDLYEQISVFLKQIPIKSFNKSFTSSIKEQNFEQLKQSYRSTTSYMFKAIHQNKNIETRTRNKMKLRLFCCHMINRIFKRADVVINFPCFFKWLKSNNIQMINHFDFFYFQQWIGEEEDANLEASISLLHRTFF